jgi:2-succinyl-5-enolpyruvyl-6-hydroxy-3-cyclohexene-1-carboxylate synthase
MLDFFSQFAKKLEESGCQEIVICAGSQNAPLVARLRQLSQFQLHHHFDERSAAFFALGRAATNSRTVAVLTTSGTAVAECVPAMCEAYARQVPLLLLSADASSRFKNSAYPQTFDQFSLTQSCRVRGIELESNLDEFRPGPLSGPEHWNLRLPDPVFETGSPPRKQNCLNEFLEFPDLFIWVGPIYCERERGLVRKLLRAHRGPFYAEALSGLQHEVAHNENFLDPEDWVDLDPRPPVLKLGHAPFHKVWRDLDRLQSLREVPVFSVSGSAEHHRESQHLPLDRLAGSCLWSELPSELKTKARPRSANPSANHKLEVYRDSIEAIHAQIPAGSTVYLANSLAIRVWEKWNPNRSKKFRYAAARGLNGIDGQVASFLALSSPDQEAWLVVGDLTLLYDSNALDFLRRRPHRVRIVLLDNGGGQIFRELSYFPKAFPNSEAAALICNPQERDWSLWARFWGLDYFTDPRVFEDSSQHCLIHCKILGHE